MKNKIIQLFAFTFAAHLLYAAVPLKWTVETSRVQPVAFEAVRGETLAFEAAFNSYGTALELPSNAAYSLFYQTNGMGSAWWTVPATAVSNRISAVFAPTNDPGAGAVQGFLGTAGGMYRAAFTLRFRHGPGATPNAIALPAAVLDCAAVTFLNPDSAPWSSGGVTPQAVTNAVASAAVTNLGATAYADAKFLPLDGYGVLNTALLIGNGNDYNDIIFQIGSGPLGTSFINLGFENGSNLPFIFSTCLEDGTWPESYLTPDDSPVATSNMVTRMDAAYFDANADYALTNVTGAAVTLTSGEIASVSLASAQTSLAVTLDFSDATDRSGDAMVYLVNAADTSLSVLPASTVAPVGYDLSTAIGAGTNVVMFTRMKVASGVSTVLVTVKEL